MTRLHSPGHGVRRRCALAVFGVIGLLALVGCARAPAADPAPTAKVDGSAIVFPSNSPQLKVLRSEAVDAGTDALLQLPARLGWDETRSSALRSPLPGQVASIEAVPGQRVKVGQVLAWIVAPEIGQAQAERSRGTAELRRARSELARVRELHQAGVASGRELEEAEAALAGSQADQQRVLALTRGYGSAAGIDQRMALRSPIDGVLVERRMSPGMAVSAEAEVPLAVVSDPERLWLLVDVPEQLAARVQRGQQVSLGGSEGAGEVQAPLDYVAAYIDPERRVLQARAQIDNRAGRYKAGQYLRATIRVPMPGGVSVPDAAVLLLGRQQVVFLDQGQGRYLRQPVVAEALGEGRLWVRDGLAAGSRVVVDGGLLLQQLLDQHGVGATP